MRPGALFFLVLAVLPLAACGSSGGDGWSGPPAADGGGHVSTGGFDDYLDANRDAAASPVVAATRFVGLDRTAGATTSVIARSTGEGSGPTTVVVTLDRLPDDSVRAERYLLAFTREDGAWRLASAVKAQRCWPARGHQRFSAKPCL